MDLNPDPALNFDVNPNSDQAYFLTDPHPNHGPVEVLIGTLIFFQMLLGHNIVP